MLVGCGWCLGSCQALSQLPRRGDKNGCARLGEGTAEARNRRAVGGGRPCGSEPERGAGWGDGRVVRLGGGQPCSAERVREAAVCRTGVKGRFVGSSSSPLLLFLVAFSPLGVESGSQRRRGSARGDVVLASPLFSTRRLLE